MGYKYSILGYISINSNKDFSPLKNDLFDFQLALLSSELELFDAVFGKRFALAALSTYYNYTEIVKTLSFDLKHNWIKFTSWRILHAFCRSFSLHCTTEPNTKYICSKWIYHKTWNKIILESGWIDLGNRERGESVAKRLQSHFFT